MTTQTAIRNLPSHRTHHSQVLQQLDAEWNSLSDSAAATAALNRWSAHSAELGTHRTLDDLVQHIQTASGADQDRVLKDLIRAGQGGDTTAVRVLVQAFLPAILRLSRRVYTPGNTDTEERLQLSLITFWEVVTTSAGLGRAQTKIAARLTLDTLKRMTAPNRLQGSPDGRWNRFVHVGQDVDEVLQARGVEDRPYLSGAPDPDASLDDVLVWALEVDALNRTDAQLLAEVYIAGRSQRELAQTRGVTSVSLRKRCERARRNLITAVHADLEHRGQIANAS